MMGYLRKHFSDVKIIVIGDGRESLKQKKKKKKNKKQKKQKNNKKTKKKREKSGETKTLRGEDYSKVLCVVYVCDRDIHTRARTHLYTHVHTRLCMKHTNVHGIRRELVNLHYTLTSVNNFRTHTYVRTFLLNILFPFISINFVFLLKLSRKDVYTFSLFSFFFSFFYFSRLLCQAETERDERSRIMIKIVQTLALSLHSP